MIPIKRIASAMLIITATLCGCSQHDEFVEDIDNNNPDNLNEVPIVFQLEPNYSSSTRSVDDSFDPRMGKPEEQQVNNVRIYLFDAPTGLFVKSVFFTKLTDLATDGNGNRIFETESVLVPQGTYNIFVTANTTRVINKKKQAEFLADIDSLTYVRGQIEDISGGILMTNRAIENTNTVIQNNTNTSTTTPTENVVHITLERVLARLDIAKAYDTFQLTNENSQLYATVNLDGHYLVNLPKYYYTYRHTSVLTSLDVPSWNLNNNFGTVNDVNGYVIDPYFFNKTIDATTFNNSDKYYVNFFGDYNKEAVPWSMFLPASGGVPQFKTVYCLENCALAPAQKMGYTTGVIFRAILQPAMNSVYQLKNGVLTPLNDPAQYPEVLYYCNYKFYNSAEALAAGIGVTSLIGADLSAYQAKKFEKTDDGYRCYYTYWIRHLNNFKPSEMGVMEFAIVRNNWYQMLISNITGLGYSDLPINTDTPVEGETYLKVVINVKPWVFRDINVVL